MRILLAEDEKALSRVLVKILEKDKYAVDAVYDGESALAYLETGNYDAAILDIMMPKMDGISVLRILRNAGNGVPVIMLTAKSDVEDRVLGLDSGANDYLPKPFDTRELLARLRAITRSKAEVDSKITVGNVTLDRTTFELYSPAGSVRLANKEYQIIEMFMTSPRQKFSTERIMEKIWGYDSESDIKVVWVYISYLRKKLAAVQANVEIAINRNAGYSLEIKND